jgi:hypothetical protein
MALIIQCLSRLLFFFSFPVPQVEDTSLTHLADEVLLNERRGKESVYMAPRFIGYLLQVKQFSVTSVRQDKT